MSALAKLDRLRELDAEAAREIEACWPLTLHALRAGEHDESRVLGHALIDMRIRLEAELDEALKVWEEGFPL